MQFSELSSADQKRLTDWLDMLLRPSVVPIAKTLEQLQTILLAYVPSDGVGAVLAQLDQAAVVPYTGALAGARELTAVEIGTLAGGMTSACQTYNSPEIRALYAKACGAGNIL